jgi:hypothetical protein
MNIDKVLNRRPVQILDFRWDFTTEQAGSARDFLRQYFKRLAITLPIREA